MSPDLRAAIGAKGVSVWLHADLDVLTRRLKRRSTADRPLLNTTQPSETLERLVAERYPIYAQADVTVQSRDVPHDTIIAETLAALGDRLAVSGERRTGGGGNG
jgi:shikimate kinase